MTVELSERELDMICYALRELVGRRLEQSVDWVGKASEAARGAKIDAQAMQRLNDKLEDARH